MPDHLMSAAIRAAYRSGQEDEAMEPLVRFAADRPVRRFRTGDRIIFYDLRGEREVELTASFVEPTFAHFPIEPGLRVGFATMIEYHPDLPVRVAFPPLEKLSGTLGEAVSRAGRSQVRVSETEKAIHAGFFLNGKRVEPFPGETRVTARSPKNPLAEPEMRAAEVADRVLEALADAGPALVIVNFANVDVVGHSEDRAAIIRAIEEVDRQLGRVLAGAREHGVTAIVTADHGTVESWLYPEGTIDTGHTRSPVPFLLVGGPRGLTLAQGGSLVDVAPTVLACLGIPAPPEMTGRCLFSGPGPRPARVVLVIVDGWGLAPAGPGNLFSQARMPNFDRLRAEHPHTELQASGAAVGLPEKTVGNSEAGHLHIGAGRVVPADRVRIDAAIADGSYFENGAFAWAMDEARANGATLHLLGIVSFFSSHGSIDHLFALLEMARRRGVEDVAIHALLGRRGERPESGARYVEAVEDAAERVGVGQVVSVIGRHWALDREHHWDRIEKTYRMLVHGEGTAVRD
ncbi:MAG: alkaline phosphatase family protein [Acidobacteria bacterium]|nr:alkaline phosphatase family protein [Acidobacteriota bacterium]